MRFLFLGNADTGGQSIALCQAVNRYSSHKARAVRMNQNYIEYPYDICRDRGLYTGSGRFFCRDDVLEILVNSDVIIFDVHDRFYGWDILFEDYYQDKRVVYRQSGDSLRLHALIQNGFHSKHDSAVICTTPDLLACLPSVKRKAWVQNLAVDEVFLSGLRRAEWNPGDPILVDHSPTQPNRKGSFGFISALGEVAKEFPVRFDMIAHEPFYKALKWRSGNHIHFDQCNPEIGWYGNSGVEAAWMGQPVIVNELLSGFVETPFVKIRSRFMFEDLHKFFKNLFSDPALFSRLSEDHQNFARTFHSPRVVIKKWLDWVLENAQPWHGRRFLTDQLLFADGYRWQRGEGIEL